jgi:hypothetical protein
MAKRTGKATKKRAAPKKAVRKAAKKTAKKAAARKAVKKTAKKAARKAAAKKAVAKARKAPARKAAAKKAPARRAATKAAAPKAAKKAPAKKALKAAPKKASRPKRAARPAPIRGAIPSSLGVRSSSSSAQSGRADLVDRIKDHNETGPAITAGDLDANWEQAYSSGDEAPGGDNPTPDQDIVDEIGHALGIEYEDNEELRGAAKLEERDRHRWELDPASAEDYPNHED